MKRYLLLCVCILFSSAFSFSQDYLTAGLDAYARSDWSSAIFSFQKAMKPQSAQYNEAWYWLIMAHASAHNYQIALTQAEKFIQANPRSQRMPEVVYQRGRIFCLCGAHENSINELYAFIKRWANHSQVPSAYYWIGENLYLTGRFPEARSIFSRILIDHPQSAKVEAARYKIALIDQSKTQEELLKLLKMSHEEFLRLTEESEKREKIYNQTIEAYQKKIGEMNKDPRTAELEQLLKEERQKNIELYDALTMVEMKNQELSAALMLSSTEKPPAPEEKSSSLPADYADPNKRRKALEELRTKARKLEFMYDNLLKETK
ncbi:outer membrane protein assembly factor BamD [Treponema phagedenis]|uniref:Outer membrane protein assembly factor BamD n=1 Tax=Treponema phagedenis TaxID=162 RepID=A0A0B7GQF7_TREPH|nr:outer membrane protein assembly factor BamD [Treponema phagedenis]QEJ98449.1 outer membrane protein assembly factor BamD [Treponema phagedenis]QEK01409.1 outer membrane protein assembly factor BamD [Treponema phagedenis]QEK03956.1 outer membrane protein assembly factor BamD [Treponema phagedenis]QEK06428.1 outer membrane protein assembly factor BamD [Treponema phagedenis]QEK09572.1 outer membrane protein assembly factor BamD [Treponema phagedenis]